MIKVFEWMNLFNSTLFSLFAEIWKEEPSREEQEGTAEQKETWEREKSFAQKVGKMKQKTELGKKEESKTKQIKHFFIESHSRKGFRKFLFIYLFLKKQ